jgi:mono/diheme cytochrome c family protein
MRYRRTSWILATLALAILVLSGCGDEEETIPTPALDLATPTASGGEAAIPTQIVVVIVTPTPAEAGEGAVEPSAEASPAAEGGTPAEGNAQAAAAPQMSEDQLLSTGEQVYTTNCASCHQASGEGTSTYPALTQSALLMAEDPTQAIEIVLHGRGQMPGFEGTLSAEQIAGVLSYERNSWDNNASVVTVAQVEAVQGGGTAAQASQPGAATRTVTATGASTTTTTMPATVTATTTVTGTPTMTATTTVTATSAATATAGATSSPQAETTEIVQTTTPTTTATVTGTQTTTPASEAELPGAAGGTAPPPTWTPAPVVTRTLTTPATGTPAGETPSATGTPQPRATARSTQQATQAAGGDQQLISLGEEVYTANCASCHQPNGEGRAGLYPALNGSPIVTSGGPTAEIELVLNGRGQMPAFRDALSIEQLAGVISYVHTAWDNDAAPVSPQQVQAVKEESSP